jgi:hypothetical protein
LYFEIENAIHKTVRLWRSFDALYKRLLFTLARLFDFDFDKQHAIRFFFGPSLELKRLSPFRLFDLASVGSASEIKRLFFV